MYLPTTIFLEDGKNILMSLSIEKREERSAPVLQNTF
jgi:hypothetical protein